MYHLVLIVIIWLFLYIFLFGPICNHLVVFINILIICYNKTDDLETDIKTKAINYSEYPRINAASDKGKFLTILHI
jgi:hypothetical protein